MLARTPRPKLDTAGERLWWMVTTLIGVILVAGVISVVVHALS